MLASIRSFFEQYIAPRPGDRPEDAEARARVAAAALLVEVVRSDDHFSAAERQAVLESAERKFGLDPAESARLVELAEAESHDAHDLFQFTSQINQAFDAGRKAQLIEELWRVAYADEVLHKYEEHLIRKVADLLYVSHSTFIATKLKVQQSQD